MAEDPTEQRVRALCDAAGLPVSEEELAELVPLYRLFSEGIERLAGFVDDADAPPIRFTVEA
jgi:hypothetical protein